MIKQDHQGKIELNFSKPEEIVAATALSRGEKIELLQQWDQDLCQLMRASSERMTPAEPTQAPETLRTVRALLRRLEADVPD